MQEKQISQAGTITPEEEQLLAQVDAKKDSLLQLIKDLIAIDSRVYESDMFSDQTEIFNFVDQYMQTRGISTELYYAAHNAANATPNQQWPNLIANYNFANAGKKLQFMGHLDVVPFTLEHWDKEFPPLQGTIKGNRLYGRGAMDMKGEDACFILAMEILQEAQLSLNGSLQMWFTPDEELDGHYGARFMTTNHKDVVDAAATIIGEIYRPTTHDQSGNNNWRKRHSMV